MSHKGIKLFSEKMFMSREGDKLFSEKVHESCWGLYQKWQIS